MLATETIDGRPTTTIPHLRCAVQHQSLCQGRPLWYLLLSNPGVHSFVQSRWLDRLFPVLAQDDGQLLLSPSDPPSGMAAALGRTDAPELSSAVLHVMGVSCAPPVLYAHSDGRGSQSVAHEDTPSTSPFRQSATTFRAGSRVPAVVSGPPSFDFAQAPFTLSAAHGAPSSCTIPTAAPQTMTAAREKLLHDYQRILGTPNPLLCSTGPALRNGGSGAARPQSASALKFEDPSNRRKPVAPLSDDISSAVVGEALRPPAMKITRVSSTKLLRDEIERVRQLQQPMLIGTITSAGSNGTVAATTTSPSVTTLSIAAGGSEEALQHSEWRTPLQAKYATWIHTSHSRSQRDRFLEVAAAFCDAIITPGPSSVLQQLLAPTLQHPIVRNKAALEQQWAANGTEELREEQEMAWLKGQYLTSAFFDVSELTLLELRVFGYAPTSLSQSSRGFTMPSSSSEIVRTTRARAARDVAASSAVAASTVPADGESLKLLSEPQDLVKQRLAIQKLDPLDRTVTVELLLRSAKLRGAIRVWWDHLPKYQVHRLASTQGGISFSPLASTRRDGPEVIKRTTFDQVACLIHAALLGGSLCSSSNRVVNDLLQLAHDDWLRLFLPSVSSASSVPPAVSGSKPSASGTSIVPVLTDHHRSLLAKGAEAPLCITLDLFEVALLSILEPWMETILCEERELCLAMLFSLCFAPVSALRGSSIQFTLRPLGDSERLGSDVRRGGGSPSSPRDEEGDGTRVVGDKERADRDVGTVRKEPVTAVEPRSTTAVLAATVRPTSSTSATRSAPRGPTAASALLTLAEQLDAASDLELARKQAERNRWEDSDRTLRGPHSRDAWRREVLLTRIRNEQRRGGGIPTGGKPSSQPLIGRNFVPHDLGKAYGLERVMIQRLSKQVSETGRPEDLAAVEQANIVVHATKQLIPPDDLHHIAKYHQPVVELLRETVSQAIQRWPCGQARSQHQHHRAVSTAAPLSGGTQRNTPVENGEAGPGQSMDDCDDVAVLSAVRPSAEYLWELTSPFVELKSLPDVEERRGDAALATEAQLQAPESGDGSPALLVDVAALASLLSPPAVPRFQQPTKCKEGDGARTISAMYVRRPQSACGPREKQQPPHTLDRNEPSKPQSPLLQRVSESVRRPLSAVRAHRMGAEVPPAGKHGSSDGVIAAAVVTDHEAHLQTTGASHTSMRGATAAARDGGSPKHVIRREAPVDVIYVSPYMRKGFLPVSNGPAYSAAMRNAVAGGGRGRRPQSALQ